MPRISDVRGKGTVQVVLEANDIMLFSLTCTQQVTVSDVFISIVSAEIHRQSLNSGSSGPTAGFATSMVVMAALQTWSSHNYG